MRALRQSTVPATPCNPDTFLAGPANQRPVKQRERGCVSTSVLPTFYLPEVASAKDQMEVFSMSRPHGTSLFAAFRGLQANRATQVRKFFLPYSKTCPRGLEHGTCYRLSLTQCERSSISGWSSSWAMTGLPKRWFSRAITVSRTPIVTNVIG